MKEGIFPEVDFELQVLLKNLLHALSRLQPQAFYTAFDGPCNIGRHVIFHEELFSMDKIEYSPLINSSFYFPYILLDKKNLLLIMHK